MTLFQKTASAWPIGPLTRRCASFATLNDEERAFLGAIENKARRPHRVRARLWNAGESGAPLYLVSGWAVHARELADGRRLLFDILLPGDVIGIGAEKRAGENVMAVTTGRTVEAPELGRLLAKPDRYAGICRSFELADAERSSFRIDHMMRLARQTAAERIAHFLLELEHRMRQRGLSRDGSLPLPLTQEVIGDILGLSLVHVNRTLQQLRRDGMISLEHGQLLLLKAAELAQLSEFHPPLRPIAIATPLRA